MKLIDITRPSYTGRIRARRVTTEVERLADRARQTGEPQFRLAHGGDVSGSYPGKAKTEALLEVVLPPSDDGVQYAIRYWAEVPAQRVTEAKIADATIGLRNLADGRLRQEARDAARQEMFRRAMEDVRRHMAGRTS